MKHRLSMSYAWVKSRTPNNSGVMKNWPNPTSASEREISPGVPEAVPLL
jgi:hypothetical protein